MKRTNILKLLPDRTQRQTLKLIGDRVSALWNAADFLLRQEFFKGSKLPSYSRLCSIFKDNPDYKALPSHIAQEVLKKLSNAWAGYFRLLKLYKSGKLKYKPGPPKYRKDRKTGNRPFDFIPIKSTGAFSIENSSLNITLPADIRNGRLSIVWKGIIRYQGDYKTCEIKHDPANKDWYAHIVVEVPEHIRKKRPVKYAAGDIGARRTIAVSIQGSNISHVFSARELWKDYKYWTRQIAKEQSTLSQTGLKTSRKLKQLYRMRRLRLKHGLETLAAGVTSLLKKHDITHFKVGYPKDCREDMNFGRNNGLVHNFWAYDITLRILGKHCVRRDIEFERIDESGTSDRCHVCDTPVRRPARSVVICPVHGKLHADVNASLNILKTYTPIYGDGAQAAPAWATYRWNKHLWLARAKSLRYLSQALAA
ncbi:transposase [Candidatus Woesearchaeota archaeon]|nr:transposase [Candidatus Woesearchaeota archaeon]